MKFLVLIIAVLVLLWLLRGSLARMRGPRPGGGGANEGSAARPMLRCAQCGTHLPRDIALPGRGGVFCDAAHRDAYERTHPPT